MRRFGLRLVSTWPRQIGGVLLVGIGFTWLLTEVLNAAAWVPIVSCIALGWVLGGAVPEPAQVQERLAAVKGAPHGRGE